MGSIRKTVHYCCVSRGNRIVYAYSGGNAEIENLAALCLEKTPQFHSRYFETYNERTFGFLMEEGYVYFAIFDEGLSRQGILQFINHLKDEFKKVARKVSRGSLSRMSSTAFQEKLGPVIRSLVTSLEQTSRSVGDWPVEINPLDNGGPSPSPINMNEQQIEAASSTKAPLLGRNSNQDKKKNKDHVVVMWDIELDEHRKSTDRGVRTESTGLDSVNQGRTGSAVSLTRNRSSSGSQNARKKWWRQVRIVLAIDAAVCAVLFIVWLTICLRTECMR